MPVSVERTQSPDYSNILPREDAGDTQFHARASQQAPRTDTLDKHSQNHRNSAKGLTLITASSDGVQSRAEQRHRTLSAQQMLSSESQQSTAEANGSDESSPGSSTSSFVYPNSAHSSHHDAAGTQGRLSRHESFSGAAMRTEEGAGYASSADDIAIQDDQSALYAKIVRPPAKPPRQPAEIASFDRNRLPVDCEVTGPHAALFDPAAQEELYATIPTSLLPRSMSNRHVERLEAASLPRLGPVSNNATSSSAVSDALLGLRSAVGTPGVQAAPARGKGKPATEAQVRTRTARTMAMTRAASLDLLRALQPLEGGLNAATARKVVKPLRHLVERAARDGVDPLETHLITEALLPRLHGMSFVALCDIARLRNHNDEARQAVLKKLENTWKAYKPAETASGRVGRSNLAIAQAVLDVVAEMAHENAMAMSWDRQVAALLEGARKGNAEDIDSALREMWSGDAMLGDTDESRTERLAASVGRLPPELAHGLAEMLGVGNAQTQLARNFGHFEDAALNSLEFDATAARQMRMYLQHLRTALAASTGMSPQTSAVLRSTAGSAMLPREFPAGVIVRKSALQRTARWFSKTFRHAQPKDKANASIKTALLALKAEAHLGSQIITGLSSARQQLNADLGETRGALAYRRLMQERLSKLDPETLVAISLNLTALQASQTAGNDANQEQLLGFQSVLAQALRRETGIREATSAMMAVHAGLTASRRPQRLLDGLNQLANAECAIRNGQSEMDFYDEALRRLDPAVRKRFAKKLHDRKSIMSYVKAIAARLQMPVAAHVHYRWHQLDTLARAARG